MKTRVSSFKVIDMVQIRDNYAYICSDEIKSIDSLPDKWAVSDGQPMEPPATVTQEGNQFLILFKAGRHKTPEVANQFHHGSGGDGHMFSPFTIKDTKPAELNFCFGLRIHWKSGEFSDVYLGQGSTFGRNNWWIGSAAITYKEGRATIKKGEEVLQLSGYNDQTHAAAAEEGATAQGIPPALIWIGKKIGEKLLEEVAKLILANVNSFRISK